MSLSLILTTLATSAVDSLNPVAITQQFVLQGMVKKKWHIWFFILPTGVVNFLIGVLAYYGSVAAIQGVFGGLAAVFAQILPYAEVLLGVVLLVIFARALRKKRLAPAGAPSEEAGEVEEAKKKVRSVSPAALLALGAVATLMELATALPYFAFLAVLLSQSLALWELLVVLAVYNLIYMSPLMLLYFVYAHNRAAFDRFYAFLKRLLTKGAAVLGWVLPLALGLLLFGHAVWGFLS